MDEINEKLGLKKIIKGDTFIVDKDIKGAREIFIKQLIVILDLFNILDILFIFVLLLLRRIALALSLTL